MVYKKAYKPYVENEESTNHMEDWDSMLDDDEISNEEACFMAGWEEAGRDKDAI